MKHNLLVWLLICVSCHKPVDTRSLIRIIEKNKLTPFNVDRNLQNTVDAIGRMRIGCTVTHLGNGIAITAGHCFARLIKKNISKSFSCNLERYRIIWGYYDLGANMKSECRKILHYANNKAQDFAIIEVAPFPKSLLKLESLTLSEFEQIKIYSYPKMRSLESSDFCEVNNYLHHMHSNFISYQCSTEEGSSGAPILNMNNNLVGIHLSYDDVINRNIGLKINKISELNSLGL